MSTGLTKSQATNDAAGEKMSDGQERGRHAMDSNRSLLLVCLSAGGEVIQSGLRFRIITIIAKYLRIRKPVDKSKSRNRIDEDSFRIPEYIVTASELRHLDGNAHDVSTADI